jgi:hypothetical protein
MGTPNTSIDLAGLLSGTMHSIRTFWRWFRDQGNRDSNEAVHRRPENAREMPEQFSPDGIFCSKAVTRRS